MSGDALNKGAQNLLFGCGEFAAGEHVLIVCEDPALGWYDEAAPLAVASEARRAGITVEMLTTRAIAAGEDAATDTAVSSAENLIYFARLGDRSRFEAGPSGQRAVMSYAMDAPLLASPYGTTPYAATKALKGAIDRALFGASQITVTCPLGTMVTGDAGDAAPDGADVTVRRFPLGVPTPIPAARFCGHVALARYLTPTGSSVYEPASLSLPSPVLAEIRDGRISTFTGEEHVVEAVTAHYRSVADRFCIDPAAVHSFHAGFHNGFAYRHAADDDPDRWSNTVFTSPRTLHFHTCGAYAPGEICWMVIDPTVAVDGVALWEGGVFRPARHGTTAAVLERYPELRLLCNAPAGALGLPPAPR
ncbi:MAG: hypothetical protein AAFW98_00320 [Pseudomonadota bacterium]